jgi:hypothetical protein
MLSALEVQSPFPDTSLSTTAGDHSHSALDLRRAYITNSSSHLRAHLPTVSVDLFPENHKIAEHSACRVAIPAQAKLKLKLTDSTRIIPCPEVIVVDVQHVLTCKTPFVFSSENVM